MARQVQVFQFDEEVAELRRRDKLSDDESQSEQQQQQQQQSQKSKQIHTQDEDEIAIDGH